MSENGPIERKTAIELLVEVARHDAAPGTALHMIVLAIRAYLSYWYLYEEGRSIAPKAIAVITALRQYGLNATKASSLAKLLRPADVPPGPRVAPEQVFSATESTGKGSKCNFLASPRGNLTDESGLQDSKSALGP